MTKKATIAISGGIDSLYAAHLLIQEGYDLEGIHFITGYNTTPTISESLDVKKSNKIVCHCKTDRATIIAMSFIAEQLGIKIHIFDCSEIFQKEVVDYFIKSYLKGETPNPCLSCNPSVKFGVLLDFAMSLNADFLATGHYAITDIDKKGKCHLYKGLDTKKDQSYFLSLLSQEQLKKAKFPLGDKKKSEVIKLALKAGIEPLAKGESQDICFIKNNDYKSFLSMQAGFSSKPGIIKTSDGKEIGKHQGLHSFTIGQRRGINCPGPEPYYVVKLETQTNSLVVGFKEELLSLSCTVKNINWINKPEDSEIIVTSHIRYNHKGVFSTLKLIDNNNAVINFHEPVTALAPGQGAVFYLGSEVIGGGWIN